MGKGTKRSRRLLQAQKALHYLYGGTIGKMVKKATLAVGVRLSFLGIYGQSTLINEGANINVPQILQSQQALVCLWSISEKHSNAKSSMVSLHPVNYSQEGMLGFDVL